MKIQNNLPIRGKQTRASGQSRSDGVFHALFEAEITDVQPAGEQQTNGDGARPEHAWQSLQESISLLDQAMQCLESGDTPTQELVDNIEQLRATLHQQLTSGSDLRTLTQAEILLAVEIERMRSL
ncbi:MAG: hypothetical protein COW18_02215 [Zetaproteobacteria bacterium CG12_big_fil_rev_8_21_14_0_65_54_13]|nr:MAG: hypothetical protein COX55_00245 [Zetaproteobacteria bacterium CG23_combo_of_CG06-09_8_20_14_all_54_7]PIW51239.1 MAG: hypothetical protein COW18_02215 [Zetaproteobacteria bacterium CG12_big_fil_rev_8_21_14_0_65_54_13]PIX53537.1 MAG: hypothetical protein COZ50_12910 [Zetaproteobacteria bacterium CG_4_10_14_3_um_filter_54_28]PJA28347.1 MAG: hypothetical protein CO188_09955 [Zetaproteobacteria bacterium CG_4_9_14_3_um_filter_54_145]